MADVDSDYISVTDIKTLLGISGSTYDALLTRYVADASRAIDSYCKRRFYTPTTDETRRFDLPHNLWRAPLLLDYDLYSLTSLTNGDGTSVASTQYVLLPANKTPKYAIQLRWAQDTVWEFSTADDREQVIVVTGKWGYSSSAPGPIRQAATETVVAWWNDRLTASASGQLASKSIGDFSVSYRAPSGGDTSAAALGLPPSAVGRLQSYIRRPLT